MLKRPIKYKDFNDQECTDTYYFYLSESELVEMELRTADGFGETLKKIVLANDNQSLIAEFKKIIIGAYGEKSEDGKRFEKTDELRLQFSQTAAYNALFMELVTDDKAAIEFIRGILPSSMSQELEKELKNAANGIPNILPPPVPAT